MKKLSLIIPANNEEGSIEKTVRAFNKVLRKEKIPHEILVVNDNSRDNTERILKKLSKTIKELRYINNKPPNGYGLAIRKGFNYFKGDYVAIVMADLSDNPQNLVKMFKKALEGYDCVFGSRFIKGAVVRDYPLHKLILNRLANNLIKILFFIKYNDVTNAFKLYSKETIQGLEPFLSNHFNLAVELPLKAIVRGYSYRIVPVDWTNRKKGISKLKIKEMRSRYFFIILYCYLERLLSMGDYRKRIKN
ncbi:MAG: glycosyltransferase family 2 protein [Patescibacteria group bacterium]